MKQALRQLINDFLSAIFFFGVYSLTGSIAAGTAIAIAVGAAQFIRLKRARRAIEPMQWMSLGLVLVLGTATLLTQSPRFMMLKPSFVHFAIAAVMLRRGWMARYLPAIVHENVPETVIVGAGYAWAGLMIGLGIANVVIATQLDIKIWAWFISFGAIGAKLTALLLQYAVFRIMVRRSLRRNTRAAEAVATSRIVAPPKAGAQGDRIKSPGSGFRRSDETKLPTQTVAF
jgi:intracellular septation protein